MEDYFFSVMRAVDILYIYTFDGWGVQAVGWVFLFFKKKRTRHGSFLPHATGERQTQMPDFIVYVLPF